MSSAHASLQTQVEAFAFRQLLAHLRTRTDCQNIDLMNLSGFCRNCLAKWTLLGARKAGHSMTYDDALEYVYGEPYPEWKRKHQAKATVEQLEAFNGGAAAHAKHDELDEIERARKDAGETASASGGFAPIAGGLSEVCCTPADALVGTLGGAAAACMAGPQPTRAIRLGVLTCSDRAAAGEYDDVSGPMVESAVREYAAASGAFAIVASSREVVADDEDAIAARLSDLVSRCDIVLKIGRAHV